LLLCELRERFTKFLTPDKKKRNRPNVLSIKEIKPRKEEERKKRVNYKNEFKRNHGLQRGIECVKEIAKCDDHDVAHIVFLLLLLLLVVVVLVVALSR
jgi:hypothetical protein